MKIEELRNKLKHYADKAKGAGCEVDFYDYSLSMAVRKGDEGIWVCKHFIPERDGHEGYKLICEDVLDKWLSENRLKE